MGFSVINCELVQQVKYMNGMGIDDIISILESKSAVKDYAVILHDKDMDVEPHYHIAMRFTGVRKSEQVAKWFGQDDSRIEKCKGRWSDLIKYLTHANAPEKYQYSVDEVFCNFDYKNEIEGKNLKYYIDRINVGEIREYNQFELIPIDIWAKNKTVIKNSLEYYRERVAMDKNREIKVIFINGGTGSGKTTFAKGWCSDNNYSCCISSSSNDALQDYKGEDVLILDDLRDDSFTFADMLKILDNHTSSSIKSRYNNKFFLGHTIIITSCLELKDWYTTEKKEDRRQLFRRIEYMFKISSDRKSVNVYRYLGGRYQNYGTIDNKFYEIINKKEEETRKFLESFGCVPLEEPGVQMVANDVFTLEDIESDPF